MPPGVDDRVSQGVIVNFPLEDNTLSVMVSCIERETERARTLQQLASAGIPMPWIAYNPCNSKDRAVHTKMLANSLRCLEHVLDHDGKHMLFMEDDIDCKPAFLTWLRIAEYQEHLVTFTVLTGSRHPEEVEHWRDSPVIPPGLYRMPLTRWYGTQALFVPRPHVEGLRKYIQRTNADTAFDTKTLYYCNEGHASMYGAYPNPVQHRSPYKMVDLTHGRVDRGKRVSDTFNKIPNRPIQRLLDVRRQAWRDSSTALTTR